MRALLLRVVLIGGTGMALVAASCEFSGSFNGTESSFSGTTANNMPNAVATGVWSGSDSASGLSVTGLINAAGLATFIRGDGVQFVGQVQLAGDALSVTVQGYSAFGTPFSDGTTYGSGTLNGTVVTGSTLTATLTFTTSGNTRLTGDWSFTFAARSNDGSSTAAISGNYRDTATATVVSINGDGAMTSQDPANGCILNGAVTTHDSAHDLYEVSYSFGDCTGAYAALNGVQFTGLASLNTSGSPAQLTLAVTGAASANRYGIVSQLNGS
ncbi:MAG TPA: hypothetical protein VED45_04785 [Steroidobacteraceae bacterium]|nr:hypothetical protein [Steroidobacteraceae bacterium]